MQYSAEEHIAAAVLEGYSLRDLYPEEEETAEAHLLICSSCREALTEIEPFNTIHYTSDGLIYSRVTQLRDGSFAERHWGSQLDGGSRHGNLEEARRYAMDSFAQMFPEHTCAEACLSAPE